MKTPKTKNTGWPKEPSKVSNPVKRKKVNPVKSLPGEEDIRIKANEIYLQRIERGESGNAIDDWHKAEELLKGS